MIPLKIIIFIASYLLCIVGFSLMYYSSFIYILEKYTENAIYYFISAFISVFMGSIITILIFR